MFTKKEIKPDEINFSSLEGLKEYLDERIKSLEKLDDKILQNPNSLLAQELSSLQYSRKLLDHVKTINKLKKVVIKIEYEDNASTGSHEFHSVKEFMNFLRMKDKIMFADALGYDPKTNKLKE